MMGGRFGLAKRNERGGVLDERADQLVGKTICALESPRLSGEALVVEVQPTCQFQLNRVDPIGRATVVTGAEATAVRHVVLHQPSLRARDLVDQIDPCCISARPAACARHDVGLDHERAVLPSGSLWWHRVCAQEHGEAEPLSFAGEDVAEGAMVRPVIAFHAPFVFFG